MKRALLMAFGLMLVCTASAFAQKAKVKNKEKRFETVVKPASEYVGRYAGPDTDHYIEVALDGGGQLSVSIFEGVRRARLESIKLSEGRLTATKVYDDGERQSFAATFSNRILNGMTAFGMMIDGPYKVAQTVIISRLFFTRE